MAKPDRMMTVSVMRRMRESATADQMKFAMAMRKARAERGWRQRDLADYLNISSNSVYEWEQGRVRDHIEMGPLFQLFPELESLAAVIEANPVKRSMPPVQEPPMTVVMADKPKRARRPNKRRALQYVNGKPSVPWGIRQILHEAGTSMHAEDVYNTLEAYGWLPPNTTNGRKCVSHTLSSHEKVFTRDHEQGRGFYHLSNSTRFELVPETVVRLNPKPEIVKKLKSALPRPIPQVQSQPSLQEVKTTPWKAPTHEPAVIVRMMARASTIEEIKMLLKMASGMGTDIAGLIAS